MASTPNPKIESMIVKNDRISSTDEYESYVSNSASGLFQFGDSKVDVRAHDCGTRDHNLSHKWHIFPISSILNLRKATLGALVGKTILMGVPTLKSSSAGK